VGISNKKTVRSDIPECIRLTVTGKIVSAHCTQCGAFIAAGQSLERLDTAIHMHACVRDGNC
jgi:hypothetical protein